MSACRLAETFVGARSRAMLSLVSAFGAKSFQGTSFQSRSFRLPAAAEVLLFCLSKREVPKRKRHPAWRFPGILPGKFVSRGRAFRPDSCPGEKEPTSLSAPAERPVASASPPHRGPGVEQRAILVRTIQKSQSRANGNVP